MDQLVLKRAAASRLSGEWSEDDYDVLCEGAVVGRIMKAAAVAPLPAWRRDEREPRTDISQVELQLHGLRATPWGLHQLRRKDRGADPRVRPQRARRRAVLGCLPRGNRAVLLHAARALARAASAVAVGPTVTAATPRPAIGEAAGALKIGRDSILPENVICVPSASLELFRTCPRLSIRL